LRGPQYKCWNATNVRKSLSRTFDPFREVSTRQVNLRNRSV